MRIGVVSDTHGQVKHTLAAVRLLESLDVQAVLHCGDIGSAEIVPLFRAWPTHFVFGNVDLDRAALRDAISLASQTCHERFARLELGGRKIAMLHGDDGPLFRQTISSGEWDLVCYGHTHVAKLERRAETVVLNPGALFRATPHTMAIVDLPALEITSITVD